MYRGFKARQDFKRMRKGLVLIQSRIKGYVTRNKYVKTKGMRKENAALMI